jgi:hypothetical protein
MNPFSQVYGAANTNGHKFWRASALSVSFWWISDVRKFQQDYPRWGFRYGMREILEEIHRAVARQVERLKVEELKRITHVAESTF